MDVRKAVQIAKQWLVEMLDDEDVTNVGLEEVDYDDQKEVWRITMGFSRPWNSTRNALTTITGEAAAKRAYRVISVKDATGQVLSMKKRDADLL